MSTTADKDDKDMDRHELLRERNRVGMLLRDTVSQLERDTLELRQMEVNNSLARISAEQETVPNGLPKGIDEIQEAISKCLTDQVRFHPASREYAVVAEYLEVLKNLLALYSQPPFAPAPCISETDAIWEMAWSLYPQYMNSESPHNAVIKAYEKAEMFQRAKKLGLEAFKAERDAQRK